MYNYVEERRDCSCVESKKREPPPESYYRLPTTDSRSRLLFSASEKRERTFEASFLVVIVDVDAGFFDGRRCDVGNFSGECDARGEEARVGVPEERESKKNIELIPWEGRARETGAAALNEGGDFAAVDVERGSGREP